MNKDQVAGRAKEIKGDLKEEAGKAADDISTTVGGFGEKVAGKIQKTYGDAKESLKRGVDRVEDRTDRTIDRDRDLDR